MNTRVVVADHHPLSRGGISALLDAQPDLEVLAQASTGEEAVKAAATYLPDVVVLEMCMPDLDGVDIIRRLVGDGLAYCPERPVRVLALTTLHTVGLVYGALRAGAAGFILKSASPDVLISAVRALAVAGTWLDDAITEDLIRDLSSHPTTGETISALVRRLTPREREVLVLMAQGLGNVAIARRLVVSDATVRTHVGRILHKLDSRDRTQAVVVAYRSGLVRVAAPAA